MSRFVRASKYRHVFGTPNKREQCYDNCKTTRNAWDSNVIKVNPYFASVNWQASGGGAFAIIPLNKPGKLSNDMPLVTGHKADVLDTDFHPFNDYIVASGSEDCKVMLWSIPEGGLTSNLNDPILTLNGHGRKVGHVLFHPTVDNLLASSSADLTIKLWDVTTGQEKQTLAGMLDFVTDLSWNYTGSLLSTVSRDKKLRIFDVRSGKIAQETDSHQGVKGSRCVWLGNTDRIATSGFSKTSDRQLYLWDNRNFGDAIKKDNLDTSSGVLMLFYDADTTMLYVGGKGDGNIRYYEYADDSLHYLAEYKSADPQRGLAFLPKRAVSVSDIETARCYKITPTLIEPISFRVPRKSDIFQTDLYPPALADEPALTIPEFFSGKTANPKTVSLEGGFKATGKKEFKTAVTEEAPKKDILNPKTEKEYQESFHHLRKENEQLKNELAQAQVRIRQLELQSKN